MTAREWKSSDFFSISQFPPASTIIVCKTCRCGVRPGHLLGHLENPAHRHYPLSPNNRQSIVEEILQQTDGANFDLTPPEGCLTPITDLETHANGRRCIVVGDKCKHISHVTATDLNPIKDHLRKEHDFCDREAKKGRPNAQEVERKTSLVDSVTRPVLFWQQTYPFAVPDGRSDYFRFEVTGPVHPGSAQDSPPDEALDRFWKQQTEEAEREAGSRASFVQELPSRHDNYWLEHTDWPARFRGIGFESMREFIREPGEGTVERLIWEATGSMLRKARLAAMKSSSPDLRVVAARRSDGSTSNRPLNLLKNESSAQRMALTMQKVVLCTVRARGSDDPLFKVTDRRQTHWIDLVSALARGAVPVWDRADEEEALLALRRVQSPPADVPDDVDSILNFLPTELEKAILGLLMSLFAQDLRASQWESPLITANACLGVHPHRDGGTTRMAWKDPKASTADPAQILKSARICAIYATLVDHGDDKPLDHCGSLIRLFGLTTDGGGPLMTLVRLLNYARTAGVDKGKAGSVIWSDEGQTVSMGQVKFSMSQLRQMVNRTIADCKAELLEGLLFGAEGVPAVPWPNLADDVTNVIPGWSFLRDRRSGRKDIYDEQGGWLLGRCKHQTDATRMFDVQGEHVALLAAPALAWLDREEKFLELLFAAIHFTSGQPARGRELLTLLVANTASQQRNIFIEDGYVSLVLRYHKNMAITGLGKPVLRLLPSPVGELVVLYLWLVRPFAEVVKRLLHLGHHIGPGTTGDHCLWPQHHHRGEPRRTIQHDADRARHVISNAATRVGISSGLNVAQMRQLWIAIGRRFLPTNGQACLANDDEDEEDEEETSILDAQAGHSTLTAEIHYGKLMGSRDGECATQRERFRNCSLAWHGFLGFRTRKSAFNSLAAASQRAERSERQAKLRTHRPETLLQQLLGVSAAFRGEQRAAVSAVLQGLPVVLAVLPTGGGKTLVPAIAAAADALGRTVIVVPLQALLQDMVRRFNEQFRIRCEAWSSSAADAGRLETATVVVTTPESFVSEAFQEFLDRDRNSGRLDRIVVDECHTLLPEAEEDTFRWKMTRELAPNLLQWEAQIVLLTATLPPSSVSALKSRIQLPANVAVELIRQGTRRPEVRYSIEDPSSDEDIISKLKDWLGSRPDAKFLIFCRTKDTADVVADRLDGARSYHAGLDDDERVRLLEDFGTGKLKALTATSALSFGVDIPDVDAVALVGAPPTLLEYMQQTGRAGRGPGYAAATNPADTRVYLLDQQADRSLTPKYLSMDDAVRELVQDRSSCLRSRLHRHLDGAADEPCDAEVEAPCGPCSERSQEPTWPEADDVDALLPTDDAGSDDVDSDDADSDDVDSDDADSDDVDSDDADSDDVDSDDVDASLPTDGAAPLTRDDAEAEPALPSGPRKRVAPLPPAMEQLPKRSRSDPSMTFVHNARRQANERAMTLDEVETFEKMLDGMEANCPHCIMIRRPSFQRGQGPCSIAKHMVYLTFRATHFERYTACYQCALPQSLCGRYIPSRKGWQLQPGVSCTHAQGYKCAVATAVHDPGLSAQWQASLQRRWPGFPETNTPEFWSRMLAKEDRLELGVEANLLFWEMLRLIVSYSKSFQVA